MPARDFRLDSGSSRFETATQYRLLVPPGPAPAGGRPVVVALHGMGMNAEQFRLILNDLTIPPAVWIFPDGVYPYEIRKDGAITIGHAWYIYDGNEEPFRSTMTRSADYILKLVDEMAERVTIDRSRVFLLGYSQGAYTAFHTALTHLDRVAGVVAIHGRMKAEFVTEELGGDRKIPVLVVAGEKDKAITVERARESYEILKENGFPAEFRSFPVGHMVRAVEVDAVRTWLSGLLL